MEILVVVAIVGVGVAVAAVNLFPSDAEIARRDTGYAALAVERARDTAWFGGRPTAVSFGEGRLAAWRLAADRTWAPDREAAREIGELKVTSVHVDGQPLAASERLVFLPDGIGVPFRIAVEVRGMRRAIEGDAAGRIRVVER